jgi:hypothetical protein
VEPEGAGIPSLQNYCLLHYAFNIEVRRAPTLHIPSGISPAPYVITLSRLPSTAVQVPGYTFSKRYYLDSYPPKVISTPPLYARESAFTFIKMMNEAMGAIDELGTWEPCAQTRNGTHTTGKCRGK